MTWRDITGTPEDPWYEPGRPAKGPALAVWDILETLEDYILKYRLTEHEGRVLLNKMMAVETAIKAQAAPPPPDF